MHEARYFPRRIPTIHYIPVGAPGSIGSGHGSHAHPAAIDGASPSPISAAPRPRRVRGVASVVQLIQSGHVAMNHRVAWSGGGGSLQPGHRFDLRELDAIDEGDAIRAQLVEFAGKGTNTRRSSRRRPSDDGTLDTARMSENVSHLGDAKDREDAEDRLAQICTSTLRTRCFSARPHLQRVA